MFSAQFHLCEKLMMANDAYPPDMLMRLALKTCTRAVEDCDKRCKTVICSQGEVKQPTVIPIINPFTAHMRLQRLWAQEGAVLTRGSTPFKITSLTSRVSSITCQHRQGSLSYFVENWRLSQCVRCAVSIRLLRVWDWGGPNVKVKKIGHWKMLIERHLTWSLQCLSWFWCCLQQ